LWLQVATHPQNQQGGRLTEEQYLQQFKAAAEFAALEKAGGGFGVSHLFDKLVQLQEDMVKNLDLSSFIKEVCAVQVPRTY
jgi:hypothetical protein